MLEVAAVVVADMRSTLIPAGRMWQLQQGGSRLQSKQWSQQVAGMARAQHRMVLKVDLRCVEWSPPVKFSRRQSFPLR
jgi:hypothetical protein